MRAGWARRAGVADGVWARSLASGLVLGLFLFPAGASAAVLSEAQIYPRTSVRGIACPSASQCTVTAGVLGEPNPGQEVTFDPLSPGSPVPVTLDAGEDLFGIACPSESQCTVGDAGVQELTFNPAAPVTPNPVRIETSITYSVACPSESQCTATGYPGTPTSTFDPQEPEGASHFSLGNEGQAVYSLACPSMTECVGVSDKGNEVTFNPVDPGTPAPKDLNAAGSLREVSCPSESQCSAIASTEEITFNPRSPEDASRADVGDYELESIACPSTEQCTAGESEGDIVTFNPMAPGSAVTGHIDGAIDSSRDFDLIACPSVDQCTAIDKGSREFTFDPNTPEITPQLPIVTPPPTPIPTPSPPRIPTVSPAAISSLLAGLLNPTGRRARIAALLRNDGYTLRLDALEPGTASVDWYYLPHDRSASKRGGQGAVVVAKAHRTYASANAANLKLELTRAGRKLLRHARRLAVTAKATFSPVGQAQITVSKTILLHA